jgi:hypothetical protein
MSDHASAPAADLDVSVVLPCLNEEASVAACVREAQNAVRAAGWLGEVIVVDNGSTDRSAERAAEVGARVVHESVRGYGSAILGGIRVARGRVVVMADADSTYPLDRLADVARPVLDGNVDLMVATRLEAASMESMPLLHRFVGTPVLTWLVREGTGSRTFSDSQSGFRAFDRDLADRLALRCTGMEFASEMLIRAAQHGVSVGEVPLGYRARVGESKLSTWRDGMRHLRLILGLTPHLLLWWPGVASLLLGILVYGASLLAPQGQTLGGPTWQPVFFGTILVVLGLVFAMSGALLARYSPTVAPGTRSAFMWVSDPLRIRQAWRAGLGLLLVGVTLEVVLFVLWLSDATVSAYTRLHLASLAQGLLLCGVLLVAGVGMYSLVVERRLFEPLCTTRAQA